MVSELEARFWRKVDRSGGPAACWLWTAGVAGGGYGYFCVATKPRHRFTVAHRYSWSLLHGEPGPDVLVLHRCDVQACVNPAHLFLGSQLDNMRDKTAKGRQARGVTHGMARITAAQAAALRAERDTRGTTFAALGSKFGVSARQAFRVARRMSWKHLP